MVEDEHFHRCPQQVEKPEKCEKGKYTDGRLGFCPYSSTNDSYQETQKSEDVFAQKVQPRRPCDGQEFLAVEGGDEGRKGFGDGGGGLDDSNRNIKALVANRASYCLSCQISGAIEFLCAVRAEKINVGRIIHVLPFLPVRLPVGKRLP